jgi:hypothetical protein
MHTFALASISLEDIGLACFVGTGGVAFAFGFNTFVDSFLSFLSALVADDFVILVVDVRTEERQNKFLVEVTMSL